jgi:hypothetical protein
LKPRPPGVLSLGEWLGGAATVAAIFVYCASPWCNRSATLNADWLPDDTVLLELDHRMICTACGLVGADVRPDWTPMTGSAGMGGAHRR